VCLNIAEATGRTGADQKRMLPIQIAIANG
jgi:hypothetical protein